MPEHAALGSSPPLWSAAPFAALLLSIALLPLAAPHFWHRHYPKVAAFWGLAFAAPFLCARGAEAGRALLHVALDDYLPFIILLWGLYTVSGGIVVEGTLRATPARNVVLLLLGTALASVAGTTGASLLLVRPLLRANAGRAHRAHLLVFFIFLVANAGGALTPLGDPPLFLGFLHGVPFFWTLRLLPHTALVTGVLLAIFFVLDRRLASREAREAGREARGAGGEAGEAGRPGTGEPLRLAGLRNVPLLLGILAAVLVSGLWRPAPLHALGLALGPQNLLRDVLVVVLGAASLALTPRRLRDANRFSWGPMREVAILFAAIFTTIVPAVAILKAGDSGAAAGLVASVREPWQYFWATGALSSFLDNAPTYLAFFNVLLGRHAPDLPEAAGVSRLLLDQARSLEAVAAGAVFMGAITYIGNAPNLMVRAIAEEAGVRMPSFFGFLLKWSLPILLPLYAIVGLIFFR